MLEGSGWAVGFSPTTGGGVFGDLFAQPIAISSGSSKVSKAALFLGKVGIGNLLLVSGVDLALAESGAGIIQSDAVAFGLLRCMHGLELGHGRIHLCTLVKPCARSSNQRSGQVGDEGQVHQPSHPYTGKASHQCHHIAKMIVFTSNLLRTFGIRLRAGWPGPART